MTTHMNGLLQKNCKELTENNLYRLRRIFVRVQERCISYLSSVPYILGAINGAKRYLIYIWK